MSRARRLAVPLLALAPLIAVTPARADATADQAAALQAQIRAWVADLAGPGIDLGSRVVRVTPEGDSYRFELPLAGPIGTTGWVISGDPITAIAKPLDGGAWAIESWHVPTPLRAEQQPVQNGRPHTWVLTLDGQEAHGRFDPGLTTSSGFDAVLSGYNAVTETAVGKQTMHYDRYTTHAGWQPAGDGRVTLSSQAQGDKLSIGFELARPPSSPPAARPGGPPAAPPGDQPAAGFGPIAVSIAAVHSSGRLESVAFDRLATAVRSITGMVPTAMHAARGAEVPDSLAPEDRARLHDLVVALRDLAGGVQQQTVLEHISVDVGGMGGTLDSLTIGVNAAATDGMLDTSLHLALAGIDSPLIPQGPLRDYVPRHVALTPRLSGIPANDLMALLLRAIDKADPSQEDKDAMQAEALGLLAKGPLKAGLDDVVLDLGATVLKGSGAVTIAALDDIKGTARIDATGLDALIRGSSTVPELRSAAPFLILLKGIGEQKGDTTTWNITYADGKTEVNGTDLAAMMSPPAAKPNQPPAHK